MTRRLVLLLLATALTACGTPSAADLVRQVIRARNNYDATLQSWILRPDGALYLDVLVVNNNESALGNLTVMVEQLDADSNVLDRGRIAVDVSALTAGLGQSIGVTVPGANPAVDGIRLFIESNPPEDVWSEFREFDAVRPRL